MAGNQKHVRKILKGWKALGCSWEPGPRSAGHLKFAVTLPDGRRKTVPMASSPKDPDCAVRNAIKQIAGAIEGKDQNV